MVLKQTHMIYDNLERLFANLLNLRVHVILFKFLLR